MADNNFISFKFLTTIIKIFITAAVVILYIHYFFPQSWGFYTVEPKQPLYNIYRVHNGVADKISLIRNNMSYGMGVSLKGKVLFSELYKIIRKKNLPWKPLNEDSLTYIIQRGGYILISDNEVNYFKGNFIITKTDRPSYLMLKSSKQFHPLTQYILADIR